VIFSTGGVNLSRNLRGGRVPEQAERREGRVKGYDHRRADQGGAEALGRSRDRLAPRAGLPLNRLGDYELGRRILPTEEVEASKAALEAAGVEFTNGDEPGVKLRRPGPQGGPRP
jgi:hypothetical protein